MSKISTLRKAIEELDKAEEALFKVRQAFTTDNRYWNIDHAFEDIGDTSTLLRHYLEIEEENELEEQNERS